ncbi:MAG TPA: transposase DNA-binding-containing protein, partial [Longimicrobium sp.]|nr:transposase DNA-binding-containing protein [Longimicrobium sp.]
MEWIEHELATAALGDERLNRRLGQVLARCFAQPMASLKAAMGGLAETIAAYRFFDHERLERGQVAAHWLIRGNHPARKLQTPPGAVRAPESGAPAEAGAASEHPDGSAHDLLETVQKSPLRGRRAFQVQRRVQHKKIKGSSKKVLRPARLVTLEVRAAQVELRPPWRRGGARPPVTISVVLAEETDPPAEQEPIRWILLTSLPVHDLAGASEILELYLVRWEIEVFHRVLKSGCRI